MPATSGRRRVLLQALASLALAPRARLVFGAADKDDPPDRTRPATSPLSAPGGGSGGSTDGGAGDGGAAKTGQGAAETGQGAVLTVVVTGKGKPIREAAVKFTFPATGEPERFTDQAGVATLESAAVGAAKVRVIAKGWESVLQEVVLTEGTQRLTIELKPLSGTGP